MKSLPSLHWKLKIVSKVGFFLNFHSNRHTYSSHPGVLQVTMATRWPLVIPVRGVTVMVTLTLTWSSTSATTWRATASTAGGTPPAPTVRGVPQVSTATPSVPRTAEVGKTSELLQTRRSFKRRFIRTWKMMLRRASMSKGSACGKVLLSINLLRNLNNS